MIMNLSNVSSVTAVLLIAFGLFVMYTQWKNWFDSNLPIIFYVVFFIFMQSIERRGAVLADYRRLWPGAHAAL